MMYERGDKDITPNSVLKNMKHSNPNKIVIGHININSIRQKFIFLKNIIGRNIDVLLTFKTKLDSSFPDGHFYIEGFHNPYRKERNDKKVVDIYFSFSITYHAKKLN